jgi:hypothetical protein
MVHTKYSKIVSFLTYYLYSFKQSVSASPRPRAQMDTMLSDTKIPISGQQTTLGNSARLQFALKKKKESHFSLSTDLNHSCDTYTFDKNYSIFFVKFLHFVAIRSVLGLCGL